MATLNYTREVSAYIKENTQSFKDSVLMGGSHDDATLAMMQMQAMERALVEGEIQALAARMLGNMEAASCAEIEALGNSLKLPRRAAIPARGVAVISGVIGSLIPSNISIYVGGVSYKLDLEGLYTPQSIGADGKAKISIVADNAGVNGNNPLGSDAYLGSNIIGINTKVDEFHALGGANEEDCKTEYLKRVLKGEGSKAPAGSALWYADRAMRFSGVTRTCASSCGCCPTETDIYIFAAGFPYQIPDDDFIDILQKQVFESPVGSSRLGSKLIGSKANAKKPVLGAVKIIISQSDGINASGRKQIEAEIRAMLADSCVGDGICKSDISSIARSFGGCIGNVSFEYDAALFTETETHLTARCDVFAALSEVCYAY